MCALLLAGLCLFSAAPSRAADSHPCAKGIELRFGVQEPTQGSLLLLEVHAAQPLADLKAAWGKQTLYFWSDRTAETAENVHRALVGIDLGKPLGLSALTVAAQLDNGKRLACSALLSVQDGKFIVERLRVPRRFVELSAKNRKRAQRESRLLREVWAAVTPERLWKGEFHLPVKAVEASGNFGRRRFLNGQARSPHSGKISPLRPARPCAPPSRAGWRWRATFSSPAIRWCSTTAWALYVLRPPEVYRRQGRRNGRSRALVGRVGATVRVTGAHLHWAARLNNTRVNPLDLLALFSQ